MARLYTWSGAGGCLLALLTAGCGGPFTGEVSGKVTHKGKPLPGGIVTFVHPDGRIGQGQIQEDGSYFVGDAPGGDVKVVVKTVPPIPALPSALTPKGIGGGKAETVYPAGKYVKISDKYGNTDTSPFAVNVKRGSQVYNIDMPD